ncbi:DDE-type integrase/transposase/recombinase [Myxococcota bacterium]
MAAREELIQAMRTRYRRAARTEKSKILDEIESLTGFHRKHAIRLMSTDSEKKTTGTRCGRRVYDEAVHDVLVILWETTDRLCGKRLKAAIPTLIDSMERHGHLEMDDVVRDKLLRISPATIDRVLGPSRVEGGSSKRRRPGAPNSVKRRVPVRTFADWHDPPPGFFEGDFVAHCGGSMAGKFVHSFVLTDIASGWTDCVPLVVREQSLVTKALDIFSELLPVPILGFDTDNDGAFINDTVIDYCTDKGIEFTRSRPYRKNDQAWIEQKNGAVVRQLVGYGRLEGLAAAHALTRLFQVAHAYVNFFLPSFKLKEKKREGSKVTKRYFPPATPCDRLLANPHVSAETKALLREQRLEHDPVKLLHELRAAQAEVAEISGLAPSTSESEREDNLQQFLEHLPQLWRQAEVRPTHRKRKSPPRTWRTRVDPFAGVWTKVQRWLKQEPDTTAKELLQRLIRDHPERYSQAQLRTLQRRVRAWRREQAERLLFFDASILDLEFDHTSTAGVAHQPLN